MSNPTSNFGWQMPTATDLVTDLPADFEVFGQAVDTDFVDLLGGTTGQILAKTSATDLDFTWINNDQGDITGVTAGNGISVTDPTGPVPTVAINTAVTADLTTAQTLTNKKLSDSTTTIVDVTDATKAIKFDVAGTTNITGTIATAFTTAKTVTIPDTTGTVALTNGVINNTLTTTTGDIIYASAANTPARLGIGSTSQVLTVTGGVPVWATPSGSSGPAFKATKTGANQTVTTATFTKITYDTEDFDTAGNFASSRFTPTTAGYYQFNWSVWGNGSGTFNSMFGSIYKNGAAAGDGFLISSSSTSAGCSGSDLLYANGSTDYFEIYIRLSISGGGENADGGSGNRNRFSGVWIRS